MKKSDRKVKIKMNGIDLTVDSDCMIADLLEKAPHKGQFPPLGASIDRRFDGLYYRLRSDAKVETVDLSDREGMDVYRRTATIILCAAMRDIDSKVRLQVGQSLMDSYFFEVHNREVTSDLVNKLDKRMRELVSEDHVLIPEFISVEEGIKLFQEDGQIDKEMLLRQLRRWEVPIVTLGKFRGYAQGPVAERTGLIDRFKIHHYEHGIILGFPDHTGNLAESIPPQPKLFSTYVETKKWNELMGSANVAQLNDQIVRGKISDLIKVAEALHERKISEIADQIVARKKDVRIVFIAGPTSSGKTTLTRRLAVQLKIFGIEPVMLSLDNYYVDRVKTPKHADGTYNFECLRALDLDLLNEHMKLLIRGEEIKAPVYSFNLGIRDTGRTIPMKLGPNHMLIVEGIHGLNDELSALVPSDKKFKIYLSALSQLCIDDHNRIFTTDTRLIRRIVRDRMYRGTGAASTIRGWKSVREGEARYIFPFQESADAVFNSALPYEHSVLKSYAERFLAEVPREDPSYMEVTRIYRFFAFFIPILSAEVPHTSILREFIGGSAFRYE